ncbi:hypothetical protein AMEJIAPC_02799 [Caulobacter sp. NIBR1757]|nr:hypothetical protein AMEJIAPC_02799 [Caulobacter sp. NIBR1757]
MFPLPRNDRLGQPLPTLARLYAKKGTRMTDLKSNIAKGLIAALCSALAIAAGAASARQEAQGAHQQVATERSL